MGFSVTGGLHETGRVWKPNAQVDPGAGNIVATQIALHREGPRLISCCDKEALQVTVASQVPAIVLIG
jgi:hypothetical protein